MSQHVYLLDEKVRELISAGEVVERPASVVKELVENSLDAGATKIDVDIGNNGISSITVTDNGKGMDREDIPVAFLRHATSKIHLVSDLDAIGSLGFRGEALAAICAVSKVTLVTKTAENSIGYKYRIEGGKEIYFEECGAPDGTTISVEDIFYNTPARMKFLKKDVAERNAVEQLLWHMAMTYPNVSFRLLRDGKITMRTTGQGIYATIFDLYPRDIATRMKKVQLTSDYGVSVEGYVCDPKDARASRSLQHVSVNGRYIKNKGIQSAAEEAYRSFVMVGRYPAFVLYVKLPLEDVDVNVHPAKTEIRFKNERQVTGTVYNAIRTTITETARNTDDILKTDNNDVNQGTLPPATGIRTESSPETAVKNDSIEKGKTTDRLPEASEVSLRKPETAEIIPEIETIRSNSGFESVKLNNITGANNIKRPEYSVLDVEVDDADAAKMARNTAVPAVSDVSVSHNSSEAPAVKNETQSQKSSTSDEEYASSFIPEPGIHLRVLGQAYKTYIIAENDDQLVFIDMHAAHERILFEKFRNEHQSVESQILLTPYIVSVELDEKNVLLDNGEALRNLGFVIEEFGTREVAVREIPTYLKETGIENAVVQIADALLDNSDDVTFEAREWLMHSVACRAAIKAGHVTPMEEMVELTEKIICGDVPKFCPHGRPVYFTLTKNEIEKRFGRIQ